MSAADRRAAGVPRAVGHGAPEVAEAVGGRLVLAVARETDLPGTAIDKLSPAERAHADGRPRQRRRRQFVAGRFLLRVLLERLTGQPGESHEIHVAGSGKPGCGCIAVSIAHCRDIIVCAAATGGDVGADVECSDSRRDWWPLARAHFSAAECAWLEGRPPADFYRLWVLKEAWLKMRGTGIVGGLSQLRCRIESPVIEGAIAEGGDCRLSLLECYGAQIGLATDRVDHRNLILLSWRKHSGRLGPTTEAVGLASGVAVGGRPIESAA